MKKTLFYLIFILSSAHSYGGKDFEIGHLLVVSDKESCFVMTGPSSIKSGFKFIFEDIEYKAVTEDEKLIYIDTKDTAFVSPEGLTIGDSVKVLNLVKEPGWAYYIKLDSGWYAASYSANDSIAESLIIEWFFKK